MSFVVAVDAKRMACKSVFRQFSAIYLEKVDGMVWVYLHGK